MDYMLLGPMEIHDRQGAVSIGGLKQRAVLAVLLLNAGCVVKFDQLIDEVWNTAPPSKALTSLRAYVANLRKALVHEPDTTARPRLATTSIGYRLDLGSDRLDMKDFETLTRRGREALAAGEPARAHVLLTQAHSMWRGPALAEFRDHEFAMDESMRLDELFALMIESHFEASLALGKHAELIPDLERRIGLTPLRERLWGQLMLALYRSHRQVEALGAYHRAEAVLAEELGIAPGAFLRDIERGIRCNAEEVVWQPLVGSMRSTALLSRAASRVTL